MGERWQRKWADGRGAAGVKYDADTICDKLPQEDKQKDDERGAEIQQEDDDFFILYISQLCTILNFTNTYKTKTFQTINYTSGCKISFCPHQSLNGLSLQHLNNTPVHREVPVFRYVNNQIFIVFFLVSSMYVSQDEHSFGVHKSLQSLPTP